MHELPLTMMMIGRVPQRILNDFVKLHFAGVRIHKLTGHVNSKGNWMGLTNPSGCWFVRLTLLSPSTGVTTSPNAHRELVSMVAW